MTDTSNAGEQFAKKREEAIEWKINFDRLAASRIEQKAMFDQENKRIDAYGAGNLELAKKERVEALDTYNSVKNQYNLLAKQYNHLAAQSIEARESAFIESNRLTQMQPAAKESYKRVADHYRDPKNGKSVDNFSGRFPSRYPGVDGAANFALKRDRAFEQRMSSLTTEANEQKDDLIKQRLHAQVNLEEGEYRSVQNQSIQSKTGMSRGDEITRYETQANKAAVECAELDARLEARGLKFDVRTGEVTRISESEKMPASIKSDLEAIKKYREQSSLAKSAEQNAEVAMEKQQAKGQQVMDAKTEFKGAEKKLLETDHKVKLLEKIDRNREEARKLNGSNPKISPEIQRMVEHAQAHEMRLREGQSERKTESKTQKV